MRRVALAGMLTHAVNALAGLGALVWLADGALDQNAMMWSLSGLGWVAAYLALVLGYLRPAQQLAGLSLVLVAITTGIDLADDGAHLASHGAGLVVAAVPVLALVAFNEQAPPVQARPWLVALPVGTVLVTAVLLHPGDGDLVDWPALACAAVFAAALACLIAPSWGGPSWPIALVLLALAALILRVTTQLEQLRYTAVPERNLPVTAALVEVVAVLNRCRATGCPGGAAIARPPRGGRGA